MDPFSLLETDGSEEKTADLVCEYAEQIGRASCRERV